MSVRKVEVVMDTGHWKEDFKAEAAELGILFGDLIEAVEHIGSTAIPGINAKPVIDIMLIVKDIEAVDGFDEQMIELGYEPKGEFGLPGRRFFMKGGNSRTHHIHSYEKGHEDIVRHIAFRDYMIQHPEEAQAYSQLKADLAEKYPENMDKYIDGKNDYIKRVEKLALEWYWENNK